MTHKLGWKEIEADAEKQLASPNYRAIITTKDAAKAIGVTIRTLRLWELAGLGPTRESSGYYRRNYFEDEVRAFAAQRKKLKAERLARRRGKA